MARTLVTFHAHPDDEALLTAGTMARAAAAGDRVVLVVATAGEVGRVGSGFLDDDEALGERRTAELRRSAEVLGVARVELLGYGDSGHLPNGVAPAGSFVAADPDAAAQRLAEILRAERADVLTVYDPRGGYGHPDHVRVHDVGYRAARLAGTPVVLEATVSRDLMRMGLEMAGALGVEIPEDFRPETFDDWYTPESEITTFVDVSAHLPAKRASMAAHASQMTGADPDAGMNVRTLAAFLSLPEDVFALAFSTEWFVRRDAPAGTREDDVFAAVGDGGVEVS